jgi:hypothetical protein
VLLTGRMLGVAVIAVPGGSRAPQARSARARLALRLGPRDRTGREAGAGPLGMSEIYTVEDKGWSGGRSSSRRGVLDVRRHPAGPRGGHHAWRHRFEPLERAR